MPLYEFRCGVCEAVTSLRCSVAERPVTIKCAQCGKPGATQVLSASSVHLGSASKVARLDPKYDRMVDQAMRNTPSADPDRVLKRLKPFPKDP